MADSPDHNETIYPTKISALRLLLAPPDRSRHTKKYSSRRFRRFATCTDHPILYAYTDCLAFVAGFYITWILPPAERPKIIISLFIALVATCTVPLIFKYFFSLALAANLVLFSGYVVTLVIYTVSGGIKGPLLHWCALFPVMAALMGCRRSAWTWAAIVFSR